MAELIVALDVDSAAEAGRLAAALAGRARFFKVGLELFTAEGPAAVEAVRRHGRVFLDLKLHDIPNTVAGAVRSAARLGVESVSVHLSGGPAMLQAAAAVSPRPKLWGVSLLTSLPNLRHLGSERAPEALVEGLARLGKDCGLEGAVCSGREASLVKAAGLKAVVPGVRPAGAGAGDQVRTVTPAEAVAAGADYLVVGRPITGAGDPAEAASRILEELA